ASGGTSGTVVEEEHATTLATTGTIPFSDPDPQDSHDLSWAVQSVFDSNYIPITEDMAFGLGTGFHSSIIDDNDGIGHVQWTFTADESDFVGLQFGENLQVVYRLSLRGDD